MKTAIGKIVLVSSLLSLVGCFPANVERLKQWQHTDNGAYAADLSKFGNYSVVSTAQGVTLWQVQQNKPKYFWQHSPNTANLVIHVDMASDNSHVVTATDKEIALWNMNSGANKGFWSVAESSIVDVKIANKGQSLLIGLLNGIVEYYELDTGRRLRFLGHPERISAIDLSDNGKYALTGSYDGKALLWDTASAQILHTVKHQGRITQVAFDQQGQYAFSANSMNESYIWRMPSGEQISRLHYPVRQQIFSSVVFSHDNRLLATGAPNKKVKLWSVASGELLAEWHYQAEGFSASVLDFSFSDDNQTLIAESSYGIVEMWDISRY